MVRSSRSWGINRAVASCTRRISCANHEIRLDETGVNRCALQIPDARVRWNGNACANFLDQTVADNDGSISKCFTGADNHFPTYERMDAGRRGMKPGRQKFGGKSVVEEQRQRC